MTETSLMDYFEAAFYPIYFLFSSIISFMVLFNHKKLKKKLKIDMMVSFMIIYLANFLISYFNFQLINVYIRVGLPMSVIFVSIYISNKVTIIGLTG